MPASRVVVALFLFLAAAVSVHAQSSPESSDAALRRQVQDLQKRLDQLEKEVAAGAAGAPQVPVSTQAAAPEPLEFADFTWLNGNSREGDTPLDTKYFTPEVLVDVSYVEDFNHPKDHSIVGSAETGRSNEFQVQQFGLGGDFHYDNVRARFMTQFGLYSTMTPNDDPSAARGQGNLANAYRYLSEANGGYHFDVGNGVNVDAGIFLSYIGLFSYYNSENWAYQPSYVSANTPWFFNGVRVQTFPTQHWKSEFWIINGWQSYGMFNEMPGFGTQQLWRPNGRVQLLTNDYWGYDTLGVPSRQRFHSDNSLEVKYYDDPERLLDKQAFSLTLDAGCESGGGVSCNGTSSTPAQQFLGFMFYNRTWFDHDLFGLTFGGGGITNPGRYLVLEPQINGASAATGSPYFTENPGQQFRAWDASATFDYMPNRFLTWRVEFDHRESNVPYFSGPGGITPPGGNTGAPGSFVSGWTPDLSKRENRINLAMLIHL
ncbi:MAG: outer membrane beta-barrel protein [Elusimicrobia bacterium]|nr:outer membrane beta-barrel protein [Elusimicrobiota bacterium]